ncbi:MAG: hypothetical protein JW941_03100, partial [Candidatus Coatesbacteria bacterium]|nr:hypothetical protein [Candidatus Coatesbacteria bacterium]
MSGGFGRFFLVLLTCSILLTATAQALEIAVALTPRSVRGVSEVVSEGAFVPRELEAFRLKVNGGPVEQVFAGRERDMRKGMDDEDCVDLAMIYKFSIPKTENALNAAYWLSKLPGVEWAEPIYDLPATPEPSLDFGD